MEKIIGKYNEAIVYTSNIEEKAVEQIKAICDLDVYMDSKIRIMPDVHAGAGCTIGTTMTITDALTPNMVGVDIGCGMETVKIKEKQIDFRKLDGFIKANIPSGMNVRDEIHPSAYDTNVFDLRCISDKEHLEKEMRAIGTLGGGNHFIEVDRDDEGDLYVVIHSGSRHLGKEVADIYQCKAYEQSNAFDGEELKLLIENMKREGREKEIGEAIKQYKQSRKVISRDLAYVKGELFDDYIHDMKIMQGFASMNRQTMMELIVEGMGLTVTEQFSTIHNYIDMEQMILRKGAVSAKKGEKLLIPINMRDGSLICIGKGNPDWNFSAPHGAGRIMSRAQAMNTLSLEEYEKQMEGIYTSTANAKTLDEAPMAYKDMSEIMENIRDTAEIMKVIKPVYNFKADS